MVTQPAYISNLKNYAKARFGDDQDIKDSLDDLSQESDRGVIILAASGVEDMLEYRILTRLPGLRDDEQTRKRMFEQDGQVASFSRKIELAYALGLIDGAYKRHIDLVREIRNACAHGRKPLSMEKDVLRVACEAVIWDMLPGLNDRKPRTIRLAFVAKCALISHYIATGEKLETVEAHLEHFAKLRRARDS